MWRFTGTLLQDSFSTHHCQEHACSTFLHDWPMIREKNSVWPQHFRANCDFSTMGQRNFRSYVSGTGIKNQLTTILILGGSQHCSTSSATLGSLLSQCFDLGNRLNDWCDTKTHYTTLVFSVCMRDNCMSMLSVVFPNIVNSQKCSRLIYDLGWDWHVYLFNF